jgi:hypothetical protein
LYKSGGYLSKFFRINDLKVVEAAGVEPVQGIENTQVTDFKKG